MTIARRPIKSIAIVGGGPSGVAAARYLQAEGCFARISVIEQRSDAGGIWNTDSRSPPQDVKRYPSPIYDGMESNIPSKVMQYFRHDFPEKTPLLPDAATVLDYLRTYASSVRPLIRFQHEVLDVAPLKPAGADSSESEEGWNLTIRDLEQSATLQEKFDAVVIASGRYTKGYVPRIPGVEAWRKAYPGSILHSKEYRSPTQFEGKKVLLVGFSSSGVDIANSISDICASPLLISQKSTEGLSPGAKGYQEGRVMFPPVIELDADKGRVTFANGHEEMNIDYIVFCTGYVYDYPFLSTLKGFGPDDEGVANSDTYQHIFHLRHPTLAFMLLPLRVVAFPFVEVQAAVVARVWAGRLCLPPAADMKGWVATRKADRGTDSKDFHKLSYPAEATYINEMHDWCLTAEKEGDSPRLPVPFWDDRACWMRENLHQIRRATEVLGKGRKTVYRIEDVGFVFGSSMEETDNQIAD